MILFDIQRNSFVDGPGIRTTVFFKGCDLRCAWCHNPESQSSNPQMMYYKSKCTGCGKCKEVCPNGLTECTLCGRCALYCPTGAREICGKEYTVDGVMREIMKDKRFYDNSVGGVTFSGGECMLQLEPLEALLIKCKENGIHTAVDTAGHVPYRYFERIMPYTDLFLYDVKCIDPEKHRRYTGVGNELIMENLKKLLSAKASVWIRIPVIPTVNDSAEEAFAIKSFFEEYGTPDKIELLPYHAMGENKYNAIGKEFQAFKTPSEDTLKHLTDIVLYAK